jgi:creatinine amidohydrolase
MSVFFGDKSWPELEEYINRGGLVILPFGTVEEHGKHLPVNTDLVLAEEISRRIAEHVAGTHPALVMPGWWSGYSVNVMQRWPGLIRLRIEVMIEAVYDVMSSLAEMGFSKMMTVNSHGMNPEIIKLAARRLYDDYRISVVTTNIWSMAKDTMVKVRKSDIGGACHGGEFETALMLYFGAPVDMDKTTGEDAIKYRSDFYPGDAFGTAKGGAFLSTWSVQDSSTGLYGDPRTATAETGEKLLNGMIEQYKHLIDEYMDI